MTTREDVEAFDNHPVWDALGALQVEVHDASPRTDIDRHTLARVGAVASYVVGYRPIDAHLFPSSRESVATTVLGHVQSITSQLEGWDRAAAMTATTVAQLDAHADALMESVRNGGWPSLQKESRAAAIRQAADEFRIQAELSITTIQADVATIEEKLTEAKSDLAHITDQADARASEMDAAVLAVEAAIAGQETKANAELKRVLAVIQTEADRHRDELSGSSATLVESLRQDAELGQKLVRLVGDQAVAEGYYRFAKREMWAYRAWNFFGIIVAVATVAFLVWAFRDIESLSVQAVIVRAVLSLPALGLATYAFGQASRRHRQSVEARYRALDLLALPPFSNDMDPAQQEKLRVVLGERLFAAPPSTKDPAKSSESGNTVTLNLDQMKVLTEVMKNLRDSAT